MMKSLINLIIYVYNNEKDIKEIIENAKKLTNEIIIIDLQSKDETAHIAKKLGAKVYIFPHPEYVELAREWGIKKAKSEWVLILDSDERIDERLVDEINIVLRQSSVDKNLSDSFYKDKLKKGIKNMKNNYLERYNNIVHPRRVNIIGCFYIPRKNIFINKWLKHGGWWPDHQIRLINTQYFVSWPKEIHSTPIIKGKVGYLKNPILHYFHSNLESMVEKTIIFENIESELLLKANRPVSILTFFRKFLGELWRRMFLRLGFMDGVFGIIESIYQAFSKTITYLFLYEKKYVFKK